MCVCINSYRWPMFCNMLDFIDQLAHILWNLSISLYKHSQIDRSARTHTCQKRTADIYIVHTHLRHVRMLLKEPAIAHSQPTAV